MSLSVQPRVLVGADVLDIMSVAMYAEPLVIYRELIQNAADAIDACLTQGSTPGDSTIVSIKMDPATRTVSLLDHGAGLSNDLFVDQMLSFGASCKRTDNYRGFRGIGRLAGLGHCRELVFRSRSKGDHFVREARWSSLRARELIGQSEIISLEALAREIVTFKEIRAASEPDSFFEARLEGVKRVSDDRLFDRHRIAAYLSEVSPLPFAPSFTGGVEIREALLRRGPLLELKVFVEDQQVYKPYRDDIEVRSGRTARIREIEYIELPAIDDRTAAYGWVAHHDYLGALRNDSPGRGLRVRSGNMQIGDWSLLAKAFPEERFNAWAIGEFHVFDGRLRANARRDAFEPSPHVDNLYNQLAPYAAAVAKRCRLQSQSRNDEKRARSLSLAIDAVEQVLGRDRTPYAVAVKNMIGKNAQDELDDLGAASNSDDIRRRVSSLARRRTSKRLSPRQRGQLDVLEWLRTRCDIALFTEAISEFRRSR